MAGPNRLENLRSLRYANTDVAFFTAFATLVTGIFLVGFIQDLGGSDLWIGLLSSIPSLVGLLQIPGAIVGRGFPSYKRFVLPGGLLNRLFYLPLIALPLAPIPDEAKLTVLVVCVMLASISGTFIGPVYSDWIAEMVPPDSRGTYFARRNAIATAVGAIIGVAGAYVLDALRSSGHSRQGFTVVFVIAAVCAAISFFFFGKMQDLPRANPVKSNFKASLLAITRPYGNRDFRRVLIFLAVFTVGQSFGGNLFGAYARESLKLDFKVIQFTAVSMALGNVLTSRFWGFLSDRYGNKPALGIVNVCVSMTPFVWLATRPGAAYNAPMLIVGHIFMGVAWGGVALCQFNLLLATADKEDRGNYLAAGMALMALMGGLSPMIGASLMSILRASFSPDVAYKIVFCTTSALRLTAVLFLVPVKEEGARSMSNALQDLRRMTPRGMRAMRTLARSNDTATRVQAIESVGREGLTIAMEDILKALHDPQPGVRRQAAASLARLQDPRATQELIHQIEEHPDLLEEEVVDALGTLGDPLAVPALVHMMQNPRSALRRAAARALGRIGQGDPNVVGALRAAATDVEDVDLRRASLQALRVLGAKEVNDVIVRGTRDAHPSVRIAAAEAVAELRIVEAAGDLRTSLREYDDEASSEVAYALGAVGEVADISMILDEAARCRSMITRRRCLLGVARLLDVEAGTYRLMLREGMVRDATVQEILKPLARRQPRVQVAVERYAAGDERGALSRLARATQDSVLTVLAEHPVDELFLVAAVAASRRHELSGGRNAGPASGVQ